MNLGPPVISRKAKDTPSRVLLYTAPKWGKTSFGAYAPKPIYLMTRGEDGLRTLINFGRVPETDHFEEDCQAFAQARECVAWLQQASHDYKTLVIDTLNGLARLLAEEVCGGRKFDGDWTEFDSYGRGIAVCEAPWIDFLAELEQLRQSRRMSVLMLAHQRSKTVKNPAGNDYDSFMPDLPDKLITHMNRWADALIWGGFDVQEATKPQQGKVKVRGGTVRTMLTCDSAAHVVGNRYGLPRLINCGTSGQDAWANFAAALRGQKPKPAKKEEPKPDAADDAPKPDAGGGTLPGMGEGANQKLPD